MTPVSPSPDSAMSAVVNTLGIPDIHYHLFLCATPSKPKCCDLQTGLETWEYLKARLRELKLDQVSAEPTLTKPFPGCVYRSKADCLRLCQQGPILLIYPDRVWYHSVTPSVMEHIIQQHLLKGQVLEDYLVYRPE